MVRKIIIVIFVLIIVVLGVYIGKIVSNNFTRNEISYNDVKITDVKDNKSIQTIEILSNEGKTTPNTIIEYKIYYTKCKHYIKRYDDIDVSMINLNEEQFKEKFRNWKIEKFSTEEVILTKEEEDFCNEHYKLKLKDNIIVIYIINENGIEKEYEKTEITTEYLTQEDILKLTNGITIYGNENLTSTIEDYE